MFGITKQNRILIVQGGTLLDDALAGLLSREADLHTFAADGTDAALLQKVSDARADAIVISEKDPERSAHLLRLLSEGADAANWRIVIVRADQSTIDVYTHHQANVTRKEDLITLLHTGENRSVRPRPWARHRSS